MEMTLSSVSSVPSAQYIAYRDGSGNIALYAANGSVSGVSGSSGATYTTNDVIGMAVDKDAGTIEFFKNGTTQGGSRTLTSNTAGDSYFQVSNYNSSVVQANFGQRPFTYTPPTGFVALNTYNLPTPTISNGANYMAATTYTGTGASQSISNAVNSISFQPDLVWIKGRNQTWWHILTDSVRGNAYNLYTNSTSSEGNSSPQGVTSFNSNGFSIGTYDNINTSTNTYVGWQWKANGAAVTNTAGSITSQVSAGATQGFSIVTYTGTGANATVGHGLGVAPKMVITKVRGSAGYSWTVGHTSIGWLNYLYLNTTAASAGNADRWQNTAPSSTVFSVGADGAVNGSGLSMVAYCWAEVAGFSKFGSYTGNGSTDGPFVFTGFRPRWVMVKRTDSVGNWNDFDTSRNTYNGMNNLLLLNTSDAEVAGGVVLDSVSNGFKLRETSANWNASGGTYIYAAFAENPTKYSLAR
jgi:hypothetical protein